MRKTKKEKTNEFLGNAPFLPEMDVGGVFGGIWGRIMFYACCLPHSTFVQNSFTSLA